MADYIELRDERNLEITETGITGTRAFVNVPGAADSLPAIGAAWAVTKPASQTFSGCKCRRLAYSMYWYDRSANVDRQKIVAHYATQNKAGGAGYILPDKDERRFQMGGEIISIDDPSANWVWVDAATAVIQPIFISVPMGSFTAQKKLTTDAAKKSWLQGPVLDRIGTINSAEFEDFRIGSVLFSGVSGGTQQDDDGDKIWVFELEFNWRLNRDATGAITANDWWYLWRQDASGSGTGKWDMPVDANNKELYAKTNLSALL